MGVGRHFAAHRHRPIRRLRRRDHSVQHTQQAGMQRVHLRGRRRVVAVQSQRRGGEVVGAQREEGKLAAPNRPPAAPPPPSRSSDRTARQRRTPVPRSLTRRAPTPPFRAQNPRFHCASPAGSGYAPALPSPPAGWRELARERVDAAAATPKRVANHRTSPPRNQIGHTPPPCRAAGRRCGS